MTTSLLRSLNREFTVRDVRNVLALRTKIMSAENMVIALAAWRTQLTIMGACVERGTYI